MAPILRPSEPYKPDLAEWPTSVLLEREFMKPSILTEDVEQYCEGGFHPIRVGSLFRGRYFIRGKLGFGGCGTVWWAKDIVQERHVAVKIISAAASKKFDTFRTFYYLPSGDDRVPHHSGRNNVVQLIRSFWHKGPNGNHLCLVLELAGPRIEDYEKHRPCGGLTLPEIQKITFDAAQALSYLHSNGYVHGDLTPSNIFMGLADPRNWNEFQLGSAEAVRKSTLSEPLLRTNGETAQPDGPRIVTSPMKLWQLDPSCLTTNIVLGDLDASFPADDGPERNFILPPLHYCAPELLIQDFPRPPDMHTDIWSLGLTIFVIRAGSLLFPRTRDVNKMFMSIWLRLGDCVTLNELWTTKGEFVNDDGNLMVYTPIHKSLRQIIEDIGRDIEVPIGATEATESEGTAPDVASTVAVKSVVEERTPVPTTSTETEFFHDLLNKMLQIDPAKRITIEEVLRHPWFSTDFGIKSPEDEIQTVEETKTAEDIKTLGNGTKISSAETEIRFE